MYRYSIVALLIAGATATTSIGAVAAAPTPTDALVVVTDDARGAAPPAVHGTETLVLADDWGTAGACVELGDVTECFDTEAELLATHREVLGDVFGGRSSGGRLLADGDTSLAAASSCSSSLRLYNATSFGGAVLFLTTRGTVHNLADFGFDNSTSSYRVGGCATVFNSLADLAGAMYPGYTGPWAQAPSMLAGWNNVVSSVYIY